MSTARDDETRPAAQQGQSGEAAAITTIAEQHGEAPVLVALPVFEGPLDLLLHLIKEHELDILDIPIAHITDEYLEYLDLMRALNIDVAAEYLLMAATLAHIKSKMLLPRPPEDQEDPDDPFAQDPREELVRRLLEYKKYKDVAETLAGGPRLGRDVFTRGAAGAEDRPPPGLEVSVFDIIKALAAVLERAKIKAPYEISLDGVSITECIRELLDRLVGGGTLEFAALFTDGPLTRERIVVTFLAILEMARRRILRLTQVERGGLIYVVSDVASVEEGEERVALAGIENQWSSEQERGSDGGAERPGGGER